MIDYEVVIEDAVVIVTHRKYSHVWRFPRTAAPHFIGTPTVIENQTADRGVSLLHDDAQSAAMGALINAQSRQSGAKIMEALTNAQSLRDEPTGAKILADLNKMYEVAKRELPPPLMETLGARIASYLREVWEEGKASQPSHVPQEGLRLYSEEFLENKYKIFSAQIRTLLVAGDSHSRLEADALSFACFYMRASSLQEGLPTVDNVKVFPRPNSVWEIKNKIRTICESAPAPFPKF
jgi:hypothetical protein